MTLYDAQETFSEGQAVTASAASDNIVKVGPGDFGQGNKNDIDVIVTEAFDNLTSLQVSLQTDSDEAFSSPTTLYSTDAIPLADLAVGYKFKMAGFPPGCEEYVRLYYTVDGTAPTVGQVDAAPTPWSQESNPSY